MNKVVQYTKPCYICLVTRVAIPIYKNIKKNLIWDCTSEGFLLALANSYTVKLHQPNNPLVLETVSMEQEVHKPNSVL